MVNPSALAAMEAIDMDSTISQGPVAWLGSMMMGRWVSFFNTGMQLISRVFRVVVSKVRMPRPNFFVIVLSVFSILEFLDYPWPVFVPDENF